MEILAGWAIFSVVVAIIAGSRDRNPFGWFFLSILISPLLALILVLALGRRQVRVSMKTCPDCAEAVLGDARVCRYCGHAFDPS